VTPAAGTARILLVGHLPVRLWPNGAAGKERYVMTELNWFICGDCMDYLPLFPDNYFDLAIVDPPYFSGPERREYYGRKISPIGVQRYYEPSEKWEVPGLGYFQELERVSKEQIVWGCNYFDYHFPPGRIVWDKCNGGSSFSDCEIASCSLHDSVRLFRYMWNGMFQGKSLEEGTVQQGNKVLNEKRIHPTQKPVALYDWLLAKYAVPAAKILDTHVGSASSLIACHKAGVSYIGFEKDRHYYELANERLEEYKSQITLWDCGLERRTKWDG